MNSTAVSKYPVSMSKKHTILNNKDICTELHYFIYSPYSEKLYIDLILPIPFQFSQGGGEYFISYLNEWNSIPKGTLSINVSTEIFSLGVIEITFKITEKNQIEIDNGNYKITSPFSSLNASSYSVEIEIPYNKGLDEISVIDFNINPDERYKLGENYILKWEFNSIDTEPGDYLSGNIFITYNYKFPFNNYIIPLFLIIISIIFTELFHFIKKTLKIKSLKTNHKNPKNKNN